MESLRGKIESLDELLTSYQAASKVGNQHIAFVSSAALVDLDQGNIRRAGNQKNYEKIYGLVKSRFHNSGFIALIFFNDSVSREVLDTLAVRVGLKGGLPLSERNLDSMRQLFLRVIVNDAMYDRANTFSELKNIFRECKKIVGGDGDFYKMAAIALAQYMLTNPCFTEPRHPSNLSIPKTWMLLLMEARVFIGSLADAGDRERVLTVFQQAIKGQEERFLASARKHPAIVKIQSVERRARKVAKFELTLADCSELFNPEIRNVKIVPKDLLVADGPRERSGSVDSTTSIDSTVSSYEQVTMDLLKFGQAKQRLSGMLKSVEGGESIESGTLINLVRSYLQQPFFAEHQSGSSLYTSAATFLGRYAKVPVAHPSLVWIQLITYARLLAETMVRNKPCLIELYSIVDDMAKCKGWGGVRRHFESLSGDLQKTVPSLQGLELDDAGENEIFSL